MGQFEVNSRTPATFNVAAPVWSPRRLGDVSPFSGFSGSSVNPSFIPEPRCLRHIKTREMYLNMNLYNTYFVSKGTGPRTVQIEAQNSAGVKAQVEARYPGAYNISHNQLPSSAKQKSE
jgi:hypothetical protein